MTPRNPDWPERLAQFIHDRRSLAFDWRSNNCGFFACDWILIAVGVDPAEEFRAYTSPIRMLRALNAAGGIVEVANRAASERGWDRTTAAFAQRGDVVAIETGRGMGLGVCVGIESAFVGKGNLRFVKTAACGSAWRIG